MNTVVLEVDAKRPEKAKIMKAARIMRKGGLVAFPTETVYGLGANALSVRAVRKIFSAKGRPFDDPIIVHVCEERQVYGLVKDVDMRAKTLMDSFWPGPLTLVMGKSRKVPSVTTGGLGTVAVRMPNHKIACALIRAAGVPIAAPSANLFGKPSPTDAGHVLEDLDGRIDCVVDGGRARIGVESTVLDISGKKAVLLRPGKVTRADIEGVIGKIKVHPLVGKKGGAKGKWAARAPGMKYRHYAPRAELVLVQGGNFRRKAVRILKGFRGRKVAVISFGKAPKIRGAAVKGLGGDAKRAARRLFRVFRELDRKGIQAVVVQAVPEKGIGMAVMNRMRKAAARVV